MRRFLVKLLLYIVIQLLLIFTYIFCSTRVELPFFSNSLAFNAKGKFLIERKILLKDYPIIVIGSSMSLNNINCKILSDKLKQPIINLSSWGMKFKDFYEFNIWEENKTIITNIHFTDFGSSRIVKKTGYPGNPEWGMSKAFNLKNIFTDFATYKDQIDQIKTEKYQNNNQILCLKFDETGSVIYSNKENFIVNPDRWNGQVGRMSSKDQDLNEFYLQIKEKSAEVKQLIISFSPCRPSMYDFEKSKSLKKLALRFKNIPNVIFINNYEAPDFTDEDFVDYCHFGYEGSKKYTELLYSQLSGIKLK